MRRLQSCAALAPSPRLSGFVKPYVLPPEEKGEEKVAASGVVDGGEILNVLGALFDIRVDDIHNDSSTSASDSDRQPSLSPELRSRISVASPNLRPSFPVRPDHESQAGETGGSGEAESERGSTNLQVS